MSAPKLFVSYSWSSPDHEAWVLQLATELCESGVDVILDKWDLKEGHNAYAFMEQMVTDPDIKKVALICDRVYVQKTNGRSGGVGTEAQIISSEIYEKQAQDKFVAVVVERDDEGRPYVPAYYRGRIYIDLSDPSSYSSNFEKLLRWIYDKPVYVKPEIGQKPSFLSESAGTTLATASRFKRAIEGVRGSRDYAIPATIEYLTLLAEQLESLRIEPKTDPFDEAVIGSIEAFMPHRNEAIELVEALALYLDTPDMRRALHRFFERLIPYLSRPEQVSTWKDWDFDNYRFIVHELFLYAVACMIRHERFESAAYLMDNEYYIPGNSDYGKDIMVSFTVFHQQMDSLEHRNNRLRLNRLSVRADLLKERCKWVSIEFRHLMQADFILFMRGALDNSDNYVHWWPETLLWLGYSPAPFEVFARSRSAAYFGGSKLLLGVNSKDGLVPVLEEFAADRQRLPHWNFTINPAALLGFDKLATTP